MNEQIEQDWLDRKLQEAAPYIEDDGFTARVSPTLPTPQLRWQFLRPLILVGMSASRARSRMFVRWRRFLLVEMFKLTTIPTCGWSRSPWPAEC